MMIPSLEASAAVIRHLFNYQFRYTTESTEDTENLRINLLRRCSGVTCLRQGETTEKKKIILPQRSKESKGFYKCHEGTKELRIFKK